MSGSRSRRAARTESQPGTNAPENVQLRISDGRSIFTPNTFAPATQIERATYRMADVDVALKVRGLALEGEAYYRWVDNFEAIGALPIDHLRDWGFQLQASAMLVPRTWEVYAFGSTVFGQYGDPWDVGLGGNYFPFRSRLFRLNAEVIGVDRSPVGNFSSPLIVGATGMVFVTNLEMFF